ncbi:hypothetical protein [Pelagimonas varians]|uniref:Uncharacterized protein n=1 Tax=Pelagimonas varians TaxID=696760 RepID=A0A238JUC9_9RHOB|nr:hypothetical protein [Pelagimonas varians]PYG34374.1 hypothetical protein C8N36_10124 [Pelagimonas varians]SMX34259.1 hypothetical protein PEV8663_00441 [Pelagimonas varians]
MTVSARINKAELPDKFICNSLAFLGRSSFEERCVSAHDELASCNFVYKHFFKSRDEAKLATHIRKKLGLSEKQISEINISDPLQTQRTIANQFMTIAEIPDDISLIIDITTFRREELLILLKEMRRLPEALLDEASFVYSVAAEMGDWLSNNVRQIRPVIGYPGDMISRQSTHLVIMAGIEHHRAVAAIDAYEPSNISLGIVPLEDSVSLEIHERNLQLRDYIVRHFDNVTTEFDFSAKSPQAVISKLRQIVSSRPDQNTIIAPLNTKLSTLACGVYGLENPAVQLCYAEVEVYNAGKYSTAGDEVLLIPYRSLVSKE